MQFDQSLAFGAGSLGGKGSVVVTGNLGLLSTSALLFQLGGTTQGTNYGFINVSGSTNLGGARLDLMFANSFVPSVDQTFTVLTSGSGLSGAFGNVANGQRFFTGDGLGSFQVNFGASSAFAGTIGVNSVVLSHFVAVPEPSTYALLGGGALLVLWSVRRRRRA